MRWRASRERSWWLFVAAVVLAVVAVVLARWAGPSSVLLGLAAVSAVGGLLLTRLQAEAKRRDERSALLAASTRTLDESGGQERVRDVDLLRLGVHRAHVELEYIRRDVEAELLTLMNTGAPVLVVGHSMAGKTRMTAQVLRDHFGDRPILLPSRPDGLARLAAHGAEPQGTVVWLDDLDRYLTGDGIRVEWLDRMRRRDNLVVATMRAREHARYQPGSQVRPPASRVARALRRPPPPSRRRQRAQANRRADRGPLATRGHRPLRARRVCRRWVPGGAALRERARRAAPARTSPRGRHGARRSGLAPHRPRHHSHDLARRAGPHVPAGALPLRLPGGRRHRQCLGHRARRRHHVLT